MLRMTQNGVAVITPQSGNLTSEISRQKQNGVAVLTPQSKNLTPATRQCRFAAQGFHCGECTLPVPSSCWLSEPAFPAAVAVSVSEAATVTAAARSIPHGNHGDNLRSVQK